MVFGRKKKILDLRKNKAAKKIIAKNIKIRLEKAAKLIDPYPEKKSKKKIKFTIK